MWAFSASPDHNRPSHREEWDAAVPGLQARAQEGSPVLRAAFRRSYRPFRVRAGWLRAAYLVAFAAFGYAYVFDASLKRVRDQIRHPDSDVLATFDVLNPESDARLRKLHLIAPPEWLHCLAVQMGRHTVFLPWGDDAVYDRITEHARGADTLQYVPGVEIAWPVGPSF